MNYKEKYNTWLTISISHEYYEDASSFASLVPAQQTSILFKKLNILFKKLSSNRYAFITGNSFSPDDELRFYLELRPSEHRFYYVSDTVLHSDSFKIRKPDSPNVWKIIEIDVNEIINNNIKDLKININTFERYYEYICIPKFHNENTMIKLREERNRTDVGEGEKVSLPGIPTAFRFTTNKKIKLSRNRPDLKMQLWEIREYGDRIISNAIPNPEPEEISIINPENTLTAYFYF